MYFFEKVQFLLDNLLEALYLVGKLRGAHDVSGAMGTLQWTTGCYSGGDG